MSSNNKVMPFFSIFGHSLFSQSNILESLDPLKSQNIKLTKVTFDFLYTVCQYKSHNVAHILQQLQSKDIPKQTWCKVTIKSHASTQAPFQYLINAIFDRV